MNSKDYWTRREQLHAALIQKQIEEKVNALVIAYKRTLRDIQDDINRNWVRYAKNGHLTMEEAMRLADRMDVERFAEKAREYVQNKDFSKQANADLKLYNLKMRVSRLKLLQLELELELDRLRGKLTNATEMFLRQQAIAEYKRQAGILGQSIDFDKAQVDHLVNASYKIAKTGNYTFNDNIWNNIERLKSQLRLALNKAILQGKNPNQFNKTLRDIFGAQPYQAGRLLITETARIQGDVQADSFKQSGFEYYDISIERSACDICKAAEAAGPYRLSDAKVGINMYPFHPNCLCSIMPADPKDR